MQLSDLTPPRDLPAGDARIPALALRGLLALCGVVLTLAVEHGALWVVLGLLLSAGAALAPEALLAWVLIAVLAVGQLSRPEALGWRPLALVAGLHLLHCLGLYTRELPWRSWIQPGVFTGPLRRYLAIQIPCQALALGALELFVAGGRQRQLGHTAALSLLGAVGLAALALVLLGREAGE